MQSSDPRHFFETDAEQAKRERRAAKSSNKFGNPVALKSKLLAAIRDPGSTETIFVAAAAGSVRRVNLTDGSTQASYKGPTAPVTCVTVGGRNNKTLFAGSWDKIVYSWDIDSKTSGRKYAGHSDFVKAVVCTRISGKDVLISGGADKKIIVWDIESGARLHTLQDSTLKMLAVQDLAVDPVESTPDETLLVSASSDPHIRRWKVRLDGWEQAVDNSSEDQDARKRTVLEHETTVYKLVFDHEGDEVDLWTSSADGSSKCLSRMKGFTSEDDFQHGDHVRAVAITEYWVITAGRDEDLKIWDRSSGRLYASLKGHYDEVTDLVVFKGANPSSDRVCSVSLDGTVRVWSLGKADIDALVQEQQKAISSTYQEEEKKQDMNGMLTIEEEAELEALMDEN